MKHSELTGRVPLAKVLPMQGSSDQGRRLGRRVATAAVLMGGAMALSACVSVNAPDKPIVIELNINIKQDVVFHLTQNATETVEKNKDVF